MQSQSKQWVDALSSWEQGLRDDNWTVVGSKGVPPPAAAMEQDWIVLAMEGGDRAHELSCLARDGAGQDWFIARRDEWCLTVPLPPRVLTTDEKLARARLDRRDPR